MAWPKGKPRPPGAGRKPGTPNKQTQTIEELCVARGCSPIEIFIDFCKGPDPIARFNAAKELAQYLYPKRRALEVDANVNLDLAKKAQEFSELPKDDQIALMEQELKRLKAEG